jgi:beta-glucosidase
VASSVRRPVKELKGVKKIYLQPGEEKQVTLSLDALSLSFYDERDKCWLAEKGAFDILLSRSSSDDAVVHSLRYDLERDITSTGVC